MGNKGKVLFDNGTHKCVMFSFDSEESGDKFLSVNQYLIVQNGSAILIDPGSEAVYEELFDAVSEYVDVQNIKFIFFSHQDPDVSGSIAQWAISTKAKFILSKLWVRFMSHYGFMEMDRVMALEDGGAKLSFGDEYLKFVPAHFLHSPGNFSVYDSKSKILFSGDIGAAISPTPNDYKHVVDFEVHKMALEGFHKRYMASNKVVKKWVERVEKLDIEIVAPQHGLLFEGEDVSNFFDWFIELECGSDIL